MTILVEATGLSLRGRLKATSLELREGELACLIGPNGSGKTSLLHALAGIGAPGGEVRIDGAPLRSAAPCRSASSPPCSARLSSCGWSRTCAGG